MFSAIWGKNRPFRPSQSTISHEKLPFLMEPSGGSGAPETESGGSGGVLWRRGRSIAGPPNPSPRIGFRIPGLTPSRTTLLQESAFSWGNPSRSTWVRCTSSRMSCPHFGEYSRGVSANRRSRSQRVGGARTQASSTTWKSARIRMV
jgi:hypothetical protein